MTITDPKSGGWSLRERLTYTAMNLIRTGLLSAIDGVGGGSYSPSAVIDIGGSNGLKISGTGSGARLRYSSRSVQRCFPHNGYTTGTDWVYPDSPHLWTTNSTTAGRIVSFTLNGLPNGATFDSLTVRFLGSTGGTVPATAPKIRAWRVDLATGTETALFAETDDPTVAISNAAYVAAHDITVSSIAHTISTKDYSYYLQVKTPGGGGTAVGAKIYGIQATCTITDQSEYDP